MADFASVPSPHCFTWPTTPTISACTLKLREMDVLADGIFIGEISARKNVVDVDDHRCVLVVLGRDEAAALERDSHGLLEAGFDQIEHRLRHVLISWRALGWPSIQKGKEESWIMGREPSVTDTACTPGMVRILSSNWRRRARVSAELVVGAAGSDKLKVIAWLGLKPGFDAPQRRQAAHHQSGADEQNQSHGDFDGDENSSAGGGARRSSRGRFLAAPPANSRAKFAARGRGRKQFRQAMTAPR